MEIHIITEKSHPRAWLGWLQWLRCWSQHHVVFSVYGLGWLVCERRSGLHRRLCQYFVHVFKLKYLRFHPSIMSLLLFISKVSLQYIKVRHVSFQIIYKL